MQNGAPITIMTGRLPERALYASGVILIGCATGTAHIHHLTIEGPIHAKFIGVLLPLSFSLLLVGAGIWLYRTAIAAKYMRRIAAWTVIGLFAGVLFGYPVVLYQAAHQIVLVDVPYLVATWITIGSLGGVLIGFYSARQREYRTKLEAERSELATRERELQRQNDRLEQFASVVSHDLRNPLNVAMGRLTLAQDEVDSEHLDDLNAALERIEALIEDILDLALQGTPIDDTEPVCLSSIATRSWAVVDTKEATLIQEDDSRFLADPPRLQQLFENVFRNAIDHGGSGVTIRVGALPDGGFYIADDGGGVSADERAEVFESGYSTATDGTGLGLAIVTEIIDGHGWAISLSESESGGARFEIRGVDMVDE